MVEMDKNDIPINIYLDLSKALDTLDHNILIDKLSYYGINVTALTLFQNYLTDHINAKTLIYSSLILSHLTFGILAWGYTCE